MITIDQIRALTKTLKTNEATALREYLQYLFLSVLYAQQARTHVYFKGGTAIHIVYHAPRFSEDMDFTVQEEGNAFTKLIDETFARLSQSERLAFKPRKSVAGKRYMMSTVNLPGLPPSYINLDFLFRENVLKPQASVLTTSLPIIFTGLVWHLSKEEIFAEKIRAVMTRKKGRDLYDLWYLSAIGVKPDEAMVQKKLAYYRMSLNMKDVVSRCEAFSEQDFVNDLRPFVPIPERKKLPQFFSYLKTYIRQTLGHGNRGTD